MVQVREVDQSRRVPPITGGCAIAFITTDKGPAKSKFEIVTFGRWYTRKDLVGYIPRQLLFRTRRSAKRFFSKPVVVRTARMATALFGNPN